MKRSRTEFERGPAAAATGRRAKPFGGTTPEEADRHLINYHSAFGDAGMHDRSFRLTRSIVVAARRWRKIANDRIRPLRQTMSRWETLFLVAFSEDGLTQTELARLISVQGPTMVRMLDQLSGEGLINRYQSASDARVTTNEITPAGMAAVREIMDTTNQLRAEVLEGIDPEKLDICLEVLGQVLRRLNEMR